MSVAAAAHAVWPERAAEPHPSDRLRGADVPTPGVLPGRLIVVESPDCLLRTIDLAQMRLGPLGPPTACQLWPSPRGNLAVVARAGAGDPSRRELWVAELGETPRLVRSLGGGRSSPSWSTDGQRLAWCRDDGTSAVLELGGADRLTELPGCFPRILAGGEVVTRSRVSGRARVYEDGRLLLDDRDLARGFPEHGPNAGAPRVFGSERAPDGGLLLGVFRTISGFTTEGSIQLWRGRRLEQVVPIAMPDMPAAGFFGLRIVAAPDLSEAALLFPEVLGYVAFEDLAGLLELPSGRPAEAFPGGRFGGLAWSPDGAWLALAASEEIRIFGESRSKPAYVLPVRARAIGWASTPAPPP